MPQKKNPTTVKKPISAIYGGIETALLAKANGEIMSNSGNILIIFSNPL